MIALGGRLWKEDEIRFLKRNSSRELSFVANYLNRTENAVYQKAISLGLDVHRSQISSKTYKKDLERFSRSGRKRYDERKEEGLCTRCGKRWAEAGRRKCRLCRERDQKHYRENNTREYLYNYKKRQKAERKENNLCVNCGQPLDLSEIGINTFCARCREQRREAQNVRRLRMRIHGIKRTDRK